MSSLFSGLGNTAQNNNNNNDAQAAQSPFGSLGSLKPPGSGLFQSRQPSSEQTPQLGGGGGGGGSGLFGRVGPLNSAQGAGQDAATTSSGSGLFGQNTGGTLGGGGLLGAASTSQSQAAPSGGLFGSTQAPQNSSAPAASGSTFGASILNNAGRQSLAQTNGQEAQTQRADDKAPRAALFQDLLERGKKRRDPNDMSMRPDQLPSLQLNLGDISSKIRGLGSNKPDFKASRAGDSRA